MIFIGLISIILIAYLGLIINLNKRKIPPSLSEGYYILEKKKKHSGIIFTFMIIAIAVSFLLLSTKYFPDDALLFLLFLSIFGLFFTGVASQFKQELTSSAHFAGAILSVIASSIWVIFRGDFHVFINILSIYGIISFIDWHNKRLILWIELFVFTNTLLQITYIIR